MMSLIDCLIALGLNLVAGVIIYYGLPVLDNDPYFRLAVAAGFVVVSLGALWAVVFMRLLSLRRAGIKNILPSMTNGPGSTVEVLPTIQRNFAFMGIAASKWTNTGSLLEETIKRVGCRSDTIRFLLLNPSCDQAKKLSMTQYNDRDHIPEIIRRSVRALKSLRTKDLNIDLRFYSFLPIFRIAIVDQRLAYVGFYRGLSSGEDSPQLVLRRDLPITYFQPFEEYFEQIWESHSQEANWDEY